MFLDTLCPAYLDCELFGADALLLFVQRGSDFGWPLGAVTTQTEISLASQACPYTVSAGS